MTNKKLRRRAERAEVKQQPAKGRRTDKQADKQAEPAKKGTERRKGRERDD